MSSPKAAPIPDPDAELAKKKAAEAAAKKEQEEKLKKRKGRNSTRSTKTGGRGVTEVFLAPEANLAP